MDITATATPEDVGLSSARLARVNRWMEALVASGKLAGLVTVVARHGRLVHAECRGKMDLAADKAMRPDTLFRIYSMTKPLTSAAIMMLYEEGRFQIDDPITRFLPAFRDMRVYTGGMRQAYQSEPAARDITFKDLLTHTSGLTYGFMESTPVDGMYRANNLDFSNAELPLAEMMERLAALPLLCQPGAEWNYSVSTDVLGALVEVISGMPFDRFLQERIIGPLGMTDTGFHVAEGQGHRLAANYMVGEGGKLAVIDDPKTSRYLKPRTLFSGGGGLVSSARDYLRFADMLRLKGEVDGVRLLGRKTVEYMTRNHLPGDMADMGQPRFSESSYAGVGFGLGFSVTLDPAKAGVIGSPGEYAWGGAASTAFWVDPVEDMIVILLTQLTPSSTYPIRRELRVLTYQAIIG
ncbi:MAG: class A beta-lactamase-related serine hydrolase [Alphaproteobacteria bacterium]|nr:class A beta-lactamase-related serine hydrolase [Alphaproteobacteria bacterium]